MAIGITQLRIRTEFTFRSAFGQVADVAAQLANIETPAAGIVDPGTWGHVKWQTACCKVDVKPLFGFEYSILQPNGKRPAFWILALDTKAMYRLSTALRQRNISSDEQYELLMKAEGVVRFAGTALTDPALFDYIDLNPASQLSQHRALALHRHTGKPLVVTSDNWYPRHEDAQAFAAFTHNVRMTPQWILTESELREQFPILTAKQFHAAVSMTNAIADECAKILPTAPRIVVKENFKTAVARGKTARLKAGHIAEWTKTYEQRLAYELKLIKEKNYESYFFVVADLVQWAKKSMLVGPARGSSAGSLACYLLRITEVDPLVHDLLFERFIDVSRLDLPDIDIDFSDQQRVFEYLPKKYGRDKVARIGNINTMRSRTVIGRVCAEFGIPEKEKFDVLDVLIEYSSGDSRWGHALEDTLTQTEPGKRFHAKYPHADLMFTLENHASHTGVHAAGVIVCNDPVSDYCTVGADGVAQLDKPDAEILCLLKIDALGLRTLSVIQDANVVNGETLYSLPLNDSKVFDLFNKHQYAGIFQYEGQAQQLVAKEIHISNFRHIDHITALSRPGPLGGGASAKYTDRHAGRSPIQYRHPSMKPYLEDTLGLVLYQEQVMRVCQEIGKFDWAMIAEIRKAMSASKGKEYFDRRGEQFIEGAAKEGLSAQEAKDIWAEICTFGAWGMNKSHTVSYSIISYWCAWLKTYYPLAFFAACLRNAKDDKQTVQILREAHAEGYSYIAFDPQRSLTDWETIDGKLIGGFKNLAGFGPAKAMKALEQRNNGTLNLEKLQKHEIKFTELFPMRKNWKHLYDNPQAVGCRPGATFMTLDRLPVKGDVLLLVTVERTELRDENETTRAARRNGQLMKGQTIFLDVHVSDDTGIPITLRFDRFIYPVLGAPAAEKLKPGDILMVRGYRIQNFSMVKVKRIQCMNRKGIWERA